MIRRIVIATLLLVAALAPSRAEERIERFISDVQVQHNGDLLVTETIAIRAEGRQVKRGILRDFPTIYHRADGSRVQVGFEVQLVTRDGQAEGFSTEKMANGVRLRIGRADRTVNPGVHQYVIHYRTTRQIGFFGDYDELYWNATGTGWTFPIDVVEARINLPERATFRQNAIYTGPQGGHGRDATVVEQQPGRIVFRTTRALPVANGLTVAVAWPKGIIDEPSRGQVIAAMLNDDPALVTAGFAGGLVLLYYLLAWLLVGRDPRSGTIIPLFEAPKGMSAASVRFVNEMGFDDRVFTAAIVGLGVNGRLKLTDDDGDKQVHHLKGTRPIDAAEQATEKALFAQYRTVSLNTSYHQTISDSRAALFKSLKDSYQGILFKNHVLGASVGLAMAIVATAAIRLAYADSYQSDVGLILIGLFIPLLPLMGGAKAIRDGRHQGGHHGRRRVLGGAAVMTVGLAIGIAILGHAIGDGPAILPALVPSLLAVVASLGFSWLKAPTRDGRKLMDEIAGLKQYLGVAEEDRLQYLNPPQKTPELFEKFLPYAIALDVENEWANRFTAVLAAAGIGAAVAAWYTSTQNVSTSDVATFTDRIGDGLSTTIASASTPPGSTGSSGWSGGTGSSDFGGGGSSGGGDSGGGGGGGGGSGW